MNTYNDQLDFLDDVNSSINSSTEDSIIHIDTLINESIPPSIKIEILQNMYYNFNIIMDHLEHNIEKLRNETYIKS